jgi:hypothetical protein
MIELGGVLTAGMVATVIPTMVGILTAYSIIAIILGALSWPAKSIPDDVGIAILGSGIVVALVLVAGIVFVRLAL